MDIEEIRTFIEVANARSFSKAADMMHVVQSTVSNRIHSLENYMGERLILRDKTGIRLTAAGETFLNYAKQMQLLNDSALREIHMASAYKDTLNISSSQWAYSYILEPVLSKFADEHPEMAVNLSIAHSEEIIPVLQNQKVDVALIPYKINNANIHSEAFCRTRILFVGSSRKFDYLGQGIQKKDLAEIPLIYSDIWENYLSYVSENLLPESKTFQARCNMLDSAKAFCLAGIGCCFLPETVVEKELMEGSLIEIPIKGLTVKYVQTYIAYNRKRMDSHAVNAWMSML